MGHKISRAERYILSVKSKFRHMVKEFFSLAFQIRVCGTAVQATKMVRSGIEGRRVLRHCNDQSS